MPASVVPLKPDDQDVLIHWVLALLLIALICIGGGIGILFGEGWGWITVGGGFAVAASVIMIGLYKLL